MFSYLFGSRPQSNPVVLPDASRETTPPPTTSFLETIPVTPRNNTAGAKRRSPTVSPRLSGNGKRRASPRLPPSPTLTASTIAAHNTLEARDTLVELVEAVPATILRDFVLERLRKAQPDHIEMLQGILDGLTPPPRQHCVRCHQSFVECENTDRSCTMEHDDDSAEVEWLGKGKGAETIWRCCGQSVPGDGDQGPPPGWCYEGKHTTDKKRAKYRDDATATDDRLDTCEKRRCGKPKSKSKRATRKRSRPSFDGDEEQTSAGGSPRSPRKKRKTA